MNGETTMSFTGKTAIITGGGSGIGRACGLGLGKQGARVAVWDVNSANASSVAEEVKDLGGRALPVRVDVSRIEQIEAATRRTLDEFGRIDILVNCAGIALTPKPLMDTTPEEFQRVFDVNPKGVWHCAKLAASEMIKR
ncbi:MAG: SDR family NAD(P)-dependent oxidoreductase, partial [Planctomycetaceae bacterium]